MPLKLSHDRIAQSTDLNKPFPEHGMIRINHISSASGIIFNNYCKALHIMSQNSLKQLEKTIIDVHGEVGKQWWDRLPCFLDHLASTERLTLLKPFANLSFNYVLPVLGPNGEKWVLKTSVPHPGLTAEISALQHFNNTGCVRLIAASAADGWMLIEQLLPGTRLVDLEDEQQAIPIAVSVMERLWHPIAQSQSFISLAQWLTSLELLNSHESLQHLIKKPLRDFVLARTQELLSSQGEQVLLHGDFHHYNILQHQSEWVAIDPKGIVGEREFEIGVFLRNPLSVIETPLPLQDLAHRLHRLIELTAFDQQRVLSWCIIQAILAACWSWEDKMPENIPPLVAYAEKLHSLESSYDS